MNLQSTIEFLTRLYENPEGKNLTRLEHEAIGEAIRRLREIQGQPNQPVETGSSRSRLRVIPGGKDEGVRRREKPDT